MARNLQLVGDLSYYDRLLPCIPLGESITPCIYQTCRSKTSLPEAIQENIARLKKSNPTWTHELFDDRDIESFILEHYGEEILGYYRRIHPVYGAARADFFRYLLVYARGGIYLDIKSTLTKPLDQVLHATDRYILSHWDNLPGGIHPPKHGVNLKRLPTLARGEWCQWFIVSVAGHPFLREVILEMLAAMDRYNPFTWGVAGHGIFPVTGPHRYSWGIEQVLPVLPADMYRILDRPQDLGLQYSIYEQVSLLHHREVLGANYDEPLEPVIASRWDSLFALYKPWKRVKQRYKGWKRQRRARRAQSKKSS